MSASSTPGVPAVQAADQCELTVSGITCMDCALKFEQAVRALPGISAAKLNTTTGLLRVEGACDLEAIRTLGRIERYIIHPRGEGDTTTSPKDTGFSLESEIAAERTRAVTSLIAVILGYLLELAGGSPIASAIPFLVAAVVGGWSNYRKAVLSVPRLDLNMAVLMSIAVAGAIGIGEYEEAGVVALLFSLSALLEGWTHERARRSIADLMDIAPKVARVQRAEGIVEVPVDEVTIGDVVLIRPGEKIPVDGVVVTGESSVVQSAITGESVPVDRSCGDGVFAGSLNGHGALSIRTTRLVGDTAIAQMIHLVEEAQASKTPAQQFVERFARVYTPAVIALAALLALVPPLLLGAPWEDWFYRALTLLVVSCPCALVVSTPVATVSAIATAARNGVLIKGGAYLEQLGTVRAVVFDKTGTLTQGKPQVVRIVPFDQNQKFEGGEKSSEGDAESVRSVLAVAAAVEQHSEHPLARAIVSEAGLQGVDVPEAHSMQALVGVGARALLGDVSAAVKSARGAVELTATQAASVTQLERDGLTALVVELDGVALGAIGIADVVRPEAAQSLAELRVLGISEIGMLTGDSGAAAHSIGSQVGTTWVEHSLMPAQKLEAVRALKAKHGTVAFVGDGINDAPALAVADVGIAMGAAGSDTALETADVVLMGDALNRIPYAVRLSRAAMRIIQQNIAFSIGIKLVALVAVYPGWLTLWLAILADMGAAVLVTLNGLRLLKNQRG